MLTHERAKAPKSREEIEGHNTGVSLHRTLHAYLKDQPRAAKSCVGAVLWEIHDDWAVVRCYMTISREEPEEEQKALKPAPRRHAA